MRLKLPLSGRILSPLPELKFLFDSSLDRNVADALALVEYTCTSVYDVWKHVDAIKDPEIIEWCRTHDYVWVHADDSAKREHGKLIVASAIRTLWVRRGVGLLSGADQLRAISFHLQEIGSEYLKRRNPPRHLTLRVHGQPPHTRIVFEPYQIPLRD